MAPAAPTAVAATPAAAQAASQSSRVVTRRFTRTVSGGRALPASRMSSQSSGQSAADALDPPERIRVAPDRILADRRVQRFALAQVTPQEGVDQRLGRRARQFARGGDRAIDDGERRRAGVAQLVQRDGRQAAQRRSANGFVANCRVSASSVPQCRSVP